MRSQRALRAEQGSVAGVPAGRRRDPPHRDAAQASASPTRPSNRRALRRARCARAGPRHLAGAAGRRKVVLATSIAETSLTIEGVRVVIDSGLARVPRYEPDVGLTRLETVRVSRAAADQRRGRAGRTEPGVCYRLWDEPQTGALEPYTRPEILAADLSSLRARSGAMGRQRSRQRWRFSIRRRGRRSARRRRCSAISARSTRRAASPMKAATLRALPLPPRLARMVVDAAARRRRRARGARSPPCSPSAASAATISICATGSMTSAATARAAPRTRARWAEAVLRGRPRSGRAGSKPRRCGSRSDRWPMTEFARLLARARLSRPHRQEPRRRQRRIPARQRPRRQCRSGFGAGARAVSRGGRTDRRGGGEPHHAGGADRARRDRSAIRRTESRTARR